MVKVRLRAGMVKGPVGQSAVHGIYYCAYRNLQVLARRDYPIQPDLQGKPEGIRPALNAERKR